MAQHYYGVTRSDNYLRHAGKLGMKWGSEALARRKLKALQQARMHGEEIKVESRPKRSFAESRPTQSSDMRALTQKYTEARQSTQSKDSSRSSEIRRKLAQLVLKTLAGHTQTVEPISNVSKIDRVRATIERRNRGRDNDAGTNSNPFNNSASATKKKVRKQLSLLLQDIDREERNSNLRLKRRKKPALSVYY